MKKKLFFYLFVVTITLLQSLLVFISVKPVRYSLKLLNLNNYTNKALLYPKWLDFRPYNVKDIVNKYSNTQYNFYFYLDDSFLLINGDEVCLKLLEIE